MRVELKRLVLYASVPALFLPLLSCDDQGPLADDQAMPPMGVVAEALGPSTVKLSWDRIQRGDVVSYQIERRVDLAGEFIMLAEVPVVTTGADIQSDNEFFDTGLDPETFYGYRVRTVLQLGRISDPSVVTGARTAPPPGIEVTTVTVAPNEASGDLDGYILRITGPDGLTEAIGSNDKRRFAPLTPGNYTVTLDDIREGCSIGAGSTRTVEVVETGLETIAEVNFQIDCQDPTRGQIRTEVVTEGDTLPQDYTVHITGTISDSSVPDDMRAVVDSASIPAVRPPGSSVEFKNLRPGSYDIELKGVDSEICSINRDALQADISVAELSSDTVRYVVTCIKGGGNGLPLVGRWTNANGGTVNAVKPGGKVFLELTAELGTESLETFQGQLAYNPDVISAVSATDLDSGATDVLTEFTGGLNTVGQVNLLTLSLTGPGTGTQGIARIEFDAVALGTTQPSVLVEVASASGIDVALSPQIPAIEVSEAGGNSAPTADAGGPYTAQPGTALALDGSASSDDGTIASYVWDFGDGSPADSSGAQVMHTYDSAGTYSLVLTVVDDAGLSDADTTSVSVVSTSGGGAPIVGTWKDSSGATVSMVNPGDTVTLEITFDASGQTPDSVLALQAWMTYPTDLLQRLGAGVELDLGASDKLAFYTGAPPPDPGGAFSILNFSQTGGGFGPQGIATLTFLTQGQGVASIAVDSALVSDNISDIPWSNGIADLGVGVAVSTLSANAGGPYSVAPGTALTLDGSASTGTIATYTWDFGDGSPVDSTSGAMPSHTYATEGTYTAALTVADSSGATATDSATVTVSQGGGGTFAWSNTWSDPAPSNGDAVTLAVSTAPGTDLRTAQGQVIWNSGVVQFDSAVGGPAFDFLFSATEQPTGTLSLLANGTTAQAAGATTPVATLHFTVVGCPGTSSATTTSGVQLKNGLLQPISLTGLAVVEDTLAVGGTSCGGAGNQAPIAVPGGPYVGTPGNTVFFDGSASSDPDGSIVDYAWDFGDGSTGAGVNPSHVYAQLGTYTVALTVRDDRGAVTTATAQVDILNTQVPTAQANGPYTGEVGTPISFTAAGSTDPDGSIVRFDWDFGDGSTGGGPAPQHTYTRVGEYRAWLTVTDDKGVTGRASAMVTVTDPGTFVWKNQWMPPGMPITQDGSLTAAAQVVEGQPGTAGPGEVVVLRISSKPGQSFLQVQGDIFWNPLVVRYDSVQPAPFADVFFQVTPGLVNRLPILAKAGAPTADTAETVIADVFFTVVGIEGDSTTTQTANLTMWDPDLNQINTTNLAIVEAPLGVQESGSQPPPPPPPPPGNQAPTASFTESCNGLTCAFDGSGSTDPDGSVASYAWNFGDGTVGTGATLSNTYAAAGTYTVSLTVTDDAGATGTTTRSVTVSAGGGGNQAPNSSYTFTCSNLDCSFDGSGSTDPDGSITGYAWDFGDGGSGTGSTATHTYGAAGTYTVTLTVTDDMGATDTSSQSVTVQAAAPSGNLIGQWVDAGGNAITSASVGQTVTLQICTTESAMNAFQGQLTFDASATANGAGSDLNSASSGVGACANAGGNDVMDQYTGAAAGATQVNILNFTISATQGSGIQGLAAVSFNLTAAGTVQPQMPVIDVATAFDGSNLVMTPTLPALTVN